MRLLPTYLVARSKRIAGTPVSVGRGRRDQVGADEPARRRLILDAREDAAREAADADGAGHAARRASDFHAARPARGIPGRPAGRTIASFFGRRSLPAGSGVPRLRTRALRTSPPPIDSSPAARSARGTSPSCRGENATTPLFTDNPYAGEQRTGTRLASGDPGDACRSVARDALRLLA